MNTTTKYLLGLGGAVVVAGAIGFVMLQGQKPAPGSTVTPAPAPQVASVPPPPADCLMPGPAPVPPDGATATAADMRLGHDVIQNFVLALEAYQSCRDAQADRAGPNVTAAQKQAWLDQGDSAVDQANAIAKAYATQLDIYKQQHPAP